MDRRGRAERRTCCGCLCGLLFSAGFLVLVYWSTFQPRRIRAAVVSATLSNLTVDSSRGSAAVVTYRLAVGISLHNPSARVSIYYDSLDAELRLLLHGGAAVLGPGNATSPSEFHQPRKSSAVVGVELDGREGGVTGDMAAELEKEIGGGVVGLEVAVHARVRYRFGVVKIRQRPRLLCPLRIPVKAEGRRRRGGGVGGVLSSGEPCSVKY